MKKVVYFLIPVLFLAGSASAASITVTQPAGDVPWAKGQTYTITWTKTGSMPNTVRITLRNKTSTAVVQEIVDGAPNSGSYMWTVPAAIPDGEYCIRVKVKGADISDDSAVFSIAAGSQQPSPAQKAKKATAKTPQLAYPVKPHVEVVTPANNATCRNGEHLYIRFIARTMPGDAFELDLYRESGQKVFNIHYGASGEGTSFPPAGPNYPNQYIYDWQVPFGDIMSPGYYKIRVNSLGRNITAWSGKFYITWPMREKEYYLQPEIKTAFCVNNISGLLYPPRPQCEKFYNPNHAYAGFDVFQHAGELSVPVWRIYIRHAQLKFPVGQFQGKKVKVIQAKLLLKKECTVAVNSNLGSCARFLYRLNAPLPQAASGDPCLNTEKTGLVTLQTNVTEEELYVTDTVEHWIDGTYPNYGLLLTVADETPTADEAPGGSLVETTCISGYSAQLYVKIEEEYKGYQ